ncbi:MAG: transcription termination/antitermination protein NusG [Clostridiales bacterium GWF2_38_85]|nr:MAG: transcription termination/antitermination protein NusG [Clostridiales bacterium GWF2_38_85]HBL83631.1 transcription termination/antitermination factor NusG [Clostridiales bacterium]
MSTDEKALWYVVHTYSGYENKVATSIEKMVENRGLGHLIQDVKIPVELVTEASDKGIKEIERKLFPSYVMVKMVMNDESWHAIRNTRGVTGFVGPGSKPVPLSETEVEALGVEVHVIEILYNVGDNVRICDGPLNGFIGIVDEISPDKKKVKVTASLFGRDTTVELDSTQVSPIN